jgi:hypothetical protein
LSPDRFIVQVKTNRFRDEKTSRWQEPVVIGNRVPLRGLTPAFRGRKIMRDIGQKRA